MIISRSWATKLVKRGDATLEGSTHHYGRRWQIVVRHDLQRVDHYELADGQSAKLKVKKIS